MNASTTRPLIILAIASVLAGFTSETGASTCGSPATLIANVQGSGTHSPIEGEQVTVEGVLTLDSRHRGGFGGFYLQQSDDNIDNDPATSEALFIHTGLSAGRQGHRIRVRGRVKEFHHLTELTDVQWLRDCGSATLPRPVAIALPWPDGRFPPEHLENMRVRIDDRLVVIDSYNLSRFGEITLAATHQPVPTEVSAPGPKAVALEKRQNRQRLVLDDNHGQRDPDPAPWPHPALTLDNTARLGDGVSELTGILDFRFGDWRLQPSQPPRFHPDNPRPAPPPRHPATTLRILTLNLGNYFNGDGRGGDFPTARGARSFEQHQQQRQRLVATLTAPDPDIIAVTELENDGNGETSALVSLARALGPEWQPIRSETSSDSDAIRNALFYRTDRALPVGPARYISPGTKHPGRPALTQTLRPLSSDTSVQIIVTHLKSKACQGARGADRDQRDGQGCFSHTRTLAARALANWVDDQQSLAAGTLITGDLNSYALETPLEVLRNAGFHSLVHRFHPCSVDQCPQTTYRFKGRKGSLDYALASASLLEFAVGAGSWAVNAEEPPALGYREWPSAATDLPWRSSDHNPVVVDLAL